MRMSCNGCRVLRKGCSSECTLKPCLQWINSPESQANATLFLAKFYGRAGLINLINAGPAHLHPEIFRSLLYEACGRIINPVHGAIGLFCSGDWAICQAAVDAVLRGSPLMMQMPGEDDELNSTTTVAQGKNPVHGCDIRHIFKGAAADLNRIRIRNRFKRPAMIPEEEPERFAITGWEHGEECKHQDDSFSVETVEPTLLNSVMVGVKVEPPAPPCEMGLELTLGTYEFDESYM